MAEGQLSQQMRVVVAWYREQDWEERRRLSADSENLEETYAEWKAVFEDGVLKLGAAVRARNLRPRGPDGSPEGPAFAGRDARRKVLS